MKEAMGDLNTSVIVLAAVALLSAVFFMVIWPMVRQGFKEEARCSDAVCDSGYISSGENEGMASCYNPQDSGKTIFYCPFRG